MSLFGWEAVYETLHITNLGTSDKGSRRATSIKKSKGERNLSEY